MLVSMLAPDPIGPTIGASSVLLVTHEYQPTVGPCGVCVCMIYSARDGCVLQFRKLVKCINYGLAGWPVELGVLCAAVRCTYINFVDNTVFNLNGCLFFGHDVLNEECLSILYPFFAATHGCASARG
jgi:hypothetical protein